ncbi:hypothetical protein COY23_01540 [bacterium (Candidatus Torokbacteria) CG_4_10_14_0_2_um_filter_35_8]|nr:MAG: hypothetical protein COY23_01540 [bacterium (Candidatus Torokbacteria) CG_4_10_14_0_2_um_filter_35_8]
MAKKKIAFFVGGVGGAVMANTFKPFTKRLDLNFIVSVFDSGGSTGGLRTTLDVCAPGDLRNIFIALLDHKDKKLVDFWVKLLSSRFQCNGDFNGHSAGNILVSASEIAAGDIEKGMDLLEKTFPTCGKVIPVSKEKSHLAALAKRRGKIVGEYELDKLSEDQIKDLWLEPNVKITKSAKKAILDADYILVGPGSIVTSLAPLFQVQGVSSTIKKSKAPIMFIGGLMGPKNWNASHQINFLKKSGLPRIDIAVFNTKPLANKKDLEAYKEENKKMPEIDEENIDPKIKIIKSKVASTVPAQKIKGDAIDRSVFRHNPKKTAKVILELL